MEQLWAAWRAGYVSGTTETTEGCVFCSLGDGHQSELVVEQSALTVTALNLYPYSSGHLLVCPKRHTPDLVSLTIDESAAVMAAAQRAVRVLTETLSPSGFNIGVNQGSASGASIDHFHLHVVPRWHGDTNFMPVIGQTKVIPVDLADLGTQLREKLAELV